MVDLHSGRAYARTACLGTMIEGKFGTELLVVGIGVRHNPLAFGGDDFGFWWGWRQWYDLAGSHFGWWWFLYLGDSCTIGTWGGATIIDEVVADGVVAERNNLEDRGVHKGWDVVAIISTSKILAAGVPNKATSNHWIASAWRSSAKLHIWLARQIFFNA